MDYEYSVRFSGIDVLWIIGIVCLVYAFMFARVFMKAGQPGWLSIIPIVNLYILVKISGKPGWWVILFLLPILNIVFIIWTYNMISKSFGKDEAFTVGLVLLGIIFFPILGFGSSKYLGPYGNPEAWAAYQAQHKFDFENKN